MWYVVGCGLLCGSVWSVVERESERGEMEQIQMRLAAKEEVSID